MMNKNEILKDISDIIRNKNGFVYIINDKDDISDDEGKIYSIEDKYVNFIMKNNIEIKHVKNQKLFELNFNLNIEDCFIDCEKELSKKVLNIIKYNRDQVKSLL